MHLNSALNYEYVGQPQSKSASFLPLVAMESADCPQHLIPSPLPPHNSTCQLLYRSDAPLNSISTAHKPDIQSLRLNEHQTRFLYYHPPKQSHQHEDTHRSSSVEQNTREYGDPSDSSDGNLYVYAPAV